jgi:endonuclease YncB( thermonuclease family)
MYWKFELLLLFGLTMASIHMAQATETETKPDLFSLSGQIEVTRVSDGDSLRSGKLKIRLFGIDAPEIKQQCEAGDGSSWSCGHAARDAMRELARSAPQLTCHLRDVDRYGRLVMQCFADGRDIAAALVDKGLALAYRDFSTEYVKNEVRAATAGRGMWQGRFSPPWEWRRK